MKSKTVPFRNFTHTASKKNSFFPLQLKPFLITQCNCTSIGSCSAYKNASAAGLDLLQRSACRSGRSPAAIRRRYKRENFNMALLQMQRKVCYWILSQICPGDWFMSLDLKEAYFHIQVAPYHRRFLIFAFEGVAYQYKILPYGLSLAPRTFTRCITLFPLPQVGIRILNYLDNWLILAQSEAVSTSHKTLLLSHLCCLGLRVNFAKSILSPSQRVLFLGTVIVQMTANVSAERATTIQRHAPVCSKLSRKCWAWWQQLRQYFSWVCFACDPSSSGWSRGFLGVTDTTA